MTYLVLILASIFIGVHNFYVNQLTTKRSILFVIFWRELVSSLMLFTVWCLSGEKLPSFNLKGYALALLAGFFAFLMLYLYYQSMHKEKKGPVSTIVYSYVGLVTIISLFLSFLGVEGYKALPSLSYIGIFFFLLGIIILSLNKTKGREGIAMAIIAMVSYAGVYLAFKPVPSLMGVIFAAFLARLSVLIVTLPILTIKKDVGWFNFNSNKIGWPTKREWLFIFLLAFLLAGGMLGISISIKALPVEYVAMGLGLTPLFTMALARIREKEKLTPKELGGIFIIILAIIWIIFTR